MSTIDGCATDGTEPARDRWASWLLRGRFGGDAELRDRTLAQLAAVRDGVLERAELHAGDTLLDVGCGDGLIGFGATDLVGRSGHVILSDVSADLLAVCREIAANLTAEAADTAESADQRFEFVHTGLPTLDGIGAEAADAVTTRSVLIYVEDIAASFAALHRVLRPGGRLSIFEPINRFNFDERPDRLWGFDMTGLDEIRSKMRTEIDGYRLETMVAFDERDLFAHAEAAGFVDLRMTYQAEVVRTGEGTVDSLLAMAPNPLVPALGQIVSAALEPAEEAAFRERVAAELAAGRRQMRLATVYLSARRA
jgi:SAM-dependent methyltransferase